MIEAKDLSYAYTVFEREAGFLNGLKDFFARKKDYVHALQDIALSIEAGESVGILGENGAGKTTLMKLLSGIITPQNPTLKVMRHIPHQREEAFLSQIGVMFGQKSQLIWDLPPIDSFHSLKVIYGIDNATFKEDLAYYCKALGVEDKLNIPTRKLSLGQRAIFNLIAAILHRPKLLLLDEPTLGIDVLSQSNIYSFLGEMRKKYGTTILLTSHNTKDIYALSERIIFLKEGKLLFDGPVNAFRDEETSHPCYLIRCKEDREPRGIDSTSMHIIRESYAYFRLSVQSPEDLKKLDFNDIVHIQEAQADLDEILKSRYGKN